MKRFTQLPAIIAAAFALHISAQALSAGPVTTSMRVPLAGTVFVPLSDGSFDAVALTGVLHMFTYLKPPPPQGLPEDPRRIRVNLDQVSGVGELAGAAIPRDPGRCE